jgi:hypothetical protein
VVEPSSPRRRVPIPIPIPIAVSHNHPQPEFGKPRPKPRPEPIPIRCPMPDGTVLLCVRETKRDALCRPVPAGQRTPQPARSRKMNYGGTSAYALRCPAARRRHGEGRRACRYTSKYLPACLPTARPGVLCLSSANLAG